MSVRFTETMKGHVTLTGGDDPAPCKFTLTIEVDDVDAHFADEDHWASATGTVDCDLFGGERPVDAGEFKSFDRVNDPKRRAMRYRLPFTDGAGNAVELVGMKDVGDDEGLDMWADTTTLAVEIRAGHNTGEYEATTAEVLASGEIVIEIVDFAKQLTTFRGNPIDIGKFLAKFNKTLADIYLGD